MPDYFRFRVRLRDVEVDLSRSFLLKKSATFGDLHRAIQDACGWEENHLYAFHEGNLRDIIAGIPDADLIRPITDAEDVSLSSFFGRKKSCIYHYDFGDDWLHDVSLEGVEKHPGRFGRRLLAGSGTFPPEDSGCMYGYEGCVAAVTGKGWEQYGDGAERALALDWLEGWRPDSFDLAETQEEFDQ